MTNKVMLLSTTLVVFIATPVMSQELAQENSTQGGGSAASDTQNATGDQTEEDSGKGNFLVLPVFITEPAIGQGLAAVLTYFHAEEGSNTVTTASSIGQTGSRSEPPPTVTGVFAFKTNADTQGAGVGHTQSFADDNYRFTGAVMDSLINTTLYLGDRPFEFAFEGNFAYANLKRRLGGSNMFVGLSMSYLTVDVDYVTESIPEGIVDFSVTDVGVAASINYEGIDQSTLPTTGQQVELTGWVYDEAIGGDFDYRKLNLTASTYHPVGDRVVLGVKFSGSTADGGVPFYARPYVSLRGIPALRYSGESVGSLQAQVRYEVHQRWAAIAFAGVGLTNNKAPIAETQDRINAYGIGFRFQAIEKHNVWIGVDVARGPEDTYGYIELGQGW